MDFLNDLDVNAIVVIAGLISSFTFALWLSHRSVPREFPDMLLKMLAVQALKTPGTFDEKFIEWLRSGLETLDPINETGPPEVPDDNETVTKPII